MNAHDPFGELDPLDPADPPVNGMQDRTDTGDATIGENLKAEITRLAGLSRHDYEVDRRAEAKRLGVRTAFLDDKVKKARLSHPNAADDTEKPEVVETLEPWADAVDGASLAEEIRDCLRAHVVFGGFGDPDVAALWIIGTYLMDTWRLWPRLLITSPTKACGKSTLLEVTDALAHRGLIVSNAKAAGIFRAIETWKPTLLLDEADTWAKQDEELAGILNSGHTRRTARVIRVVEKNGELTPTLFSTWSAMVIAGIGSQRDTLMSRSVIIGLRRKLPDEQIERLPFDLHERLIGLRRKTARWAGDHATRLSAMLSEPPECGNDRRRDNFTPLWRIAEVLGGSWPDRIAAAYVTSAQADDDDEPAGVQMLRDLMNVFDERRDTRAMQSTDLVMALTEMEERPWAEWRNGRPLTAQTIAKLMKPFGVKPGNVKMSGRVLKAYQRTQIESAFERYAAQPPKMPLPRYRAENNVENGNLTRYPDARGSGYNAQETNINQYGSGVADRSPGLTNDANLDDPTDPAIW
jgi:hypothetical protein